MMDFDFVGEFGVEKMLLFEKEVVESVVENVDDRDGGVEAVGLWAEVLARAGTRTRNVFVIVCAWRPAGR